MKDAERIDRALEGLLSPEELARFQADVLADADLRAAYAEQAWLHGQLGAERHLLPRLLEDALPDVPRSVSAGFWQRVFPPLLWAGAAAAVTAVAFLLMSPRAEEAPKGVATMVEAEGCRWAGSELPTVQGARLGIGTLKLVEGVATLAFDSGATVTLEAPTTLEVLTGMRCRLVEGSVVAEVPEPAHGFTIDAPDMQVVDHGTRFGLTASAFGNSHVIVFEGEVEVDRDDLPASRLTTGKSLHVGHSPQPATNQEISRTPALPARSDGWVAVPTSFGRGKDAYVRFGDAHGPTGAHPLIMVKHTDLVAGNERRAFLTFDLATLPVASAESAELVLSVEPSGLGFSALIPDSRFAVYGIVDDAADDWSESDLLWDSAPASNKDGLDPAKVRKLAEFEIRRGGGPSQIVVSSRDMLEFVRQDANGLASFAIVRLTGEFESQGLVHAFASKEHPTAYPPTLRLRFDHQP